MIETRLEEGVPSASGREEKRGRLRRWWMDFVEEDMREKGQSEEERESNESGS